MFGMGRLLAVANLATFCHQGYLLSGACQDFGAHGLHRPCPSSCRHPRVQYQEGPQFLALLPGLYSALGVPMSGSVLSLMGEVSAGLILASSIIPRRGGWCFCVNSELSQSKFSTLARAGQIHQFQ
jgi:hypothetical protein